MIWCPVAVKERLGGVFELEEAVAVVEAHVTLTQRSVQAPLGEPHCSGISK